MRPPRLAEWLLLHSLPADRGERDAVIGDLAEEHAHIASTAGRARAHAWYWTQTARSVLPNLRRKHVFAGAGADLRVAVRGLRKRPGFAVTATATVALGVGATAAVFSVVDATVLRGLTLPDPGRVVSVWTTFDKNGDQEFALSAAELTDVRTDARSFAQVGGWGPGTTILEPTDASPARTIDVAFTAGDIYPLAGARLVLGRLPGEGDNRIGAPRVALLTYGFWQELSGGDPNVIGSRPIRVGSAPVEVIGVLAPGVTLPGSTARAWIHTVLDPASWAANRSGHGLRAIARLQDGKTPGAARAELDALQQDWARRYAGQHSMGLDGHRVRLEPVADHVLGTARRVALLLSGAALLLLALTCANVANLLLARGESRTADVGVRMALGASARRVVQPIVFEGLVLSLAGGALGLALAAAGLPVLLGLAPEDVPSSVPVAGRVVAFAIAISVVTGAAFTVVPAWLAATRRPSTLLRASGRGHSGALRGLRTLVGAQTALATVLVIGAVLLSAALGRLNAVDVGFDASSRVAVDLTLPVPAYPDARAITVFHETVQQRVASLPGVRRVSAVRLLPLRDPVRQENVLAEGAVGAEHLVAITVQAASAGIGRALGLTLLEGRDLESGDRAGGLNVALINQSAARALWPGESAVGRRFSGTFLPRTYGAVTVAGVYGDVRSNGPAAAAPAEVILPVAQAAAWSTWVRNLTLVIETDGRPADVIGPIRGALRDLDPKVAVERPVVLRDVVRGSTSRERFLAALLAVFSALALGIAAVGVFGVVSFTVARQTREFAIRHVLGAGRRSILGGVFASTARIATAGGAAGSLLALALGPWLRSFLHGVPPRDPAVLIGVPVALVTIALLATLAPALRATRVPLVTTLRDGD